MNGPYYILSSHGEQGIIFVFLSRFMEKLLRWTSADLGQGETLAFKFWSRGLHLKSYGLLLLDDIFLECYRCGEWVES